MNILKIASNRLSREFQFLQERFEQFADVSRENIHNRIFWLFTVASVFLIVVLLINIALGKESSLGEWGDFFGGVLNPLLTFITFFGLLITIILQQKELSESRSEASRSADAQTAQVKTAEITVFENRFFHLSNLFNTIVHSIDLQKSSEVTSGKDCFPVFYRRLRDRYGEATRKKSHKEDKLLLEYSFDSFLSGNAQNLSHYFKLCEECLACADEAPANSDRYARFFAAQLSDSELLLLFYFCATGRSNKMLELVKKYEILKAMPQSDVIKESHLHLVDVAALGSINYNAGKVRHHNYVFDIIPT